MNPLLLAVTVVSLALAAIAALIAWRVVGEERRRSNARVAALSNEIYGDTDTAENVVASPLSTSRYSLIAIGACLVLTAVAAFLWGGPFKAVRAATLKPSPRVVDHKPVDAPLELLALEHERDGARLVVRGLVRNPGNGATHEGLTAVVLTYNRAGDLLASGQAAVLVAKLAPGETTPFVVNVAAADAIARFRISFRTGAHVESHVDRRSHADAAKEVVP